MHYSFGHRTNVSVGGASLIRQVVAFASVCDMASGHAWEAKEVNPARQKKGALHPTDTFVSTFVQ